MSLHRYGKTVTIPRNEHVDIHVREVTLMPDSPKPSEHVEIREYIKGAEIYGNGIIVPKRLVRDLAVAFDQVGALPTQAIGS